VKSSQWKIDFVNHASVIIHTHDIKLLTDPWYWGTCFDDGWGLRYLNEFALEQAAACTHLWISHVHGDHLHIPTLKALLEKNPAIVCYGNRSLNFQIDNILKKLGFKNVVPFFERTPLQVTADVTIERIPTTGIDNMLVLRTRDGVLLNYNDCVLPMLSRKMLARKIGPIDVFMSNFNHAGKLLQSPFPAPAELKNRLKVSYYNSVAAFNPKWAIPIASHHYYRAKETQEQNYAMLTADDLADLDSRIVPLHVGQSIEFDMQFDSYKNSTTTNCYEQPLEVKNRGRSVPIQELLTAAQKYREKIKNSYPILYRFIPPLLLLVEDLRTFIQLDLKKGASIMHNGDTAHMTAHSEALFNWFSKPYGTDLFVVGAHFKISHANTLPLFWHVLFGFLVDNKLDVRSVLKMLFHLKGLQFLFNRREEIIGVLLTRKVGADFHRKKRRL